MAKCYGDDAATEAAMRAGEVARLQTNLLVVYRMEVDETGVAELHVYLRMLTSKWLELLFTATRDNRQIRSVRGRYQRR